MLKRLLDPKAVIFCLAVTNMVQVCIPDDDWRLQTELFFSVLVLLSSLLLFIKRLWSNFLVAILTGLLPVGFGIQVLIMAGNAEVSLFGWKHIKLIAEIITSVPGVFLLLTVLSFSILTCAYCSLAQLVAHGKVSSD